MLLDGKKLVVTGVHGEHHDAHGGARLAQRAGGLQTGAVRQTQVHDHDIGLQGAGLPDPLRCRRGLADDLELPVPLERVAQTLANQVVVVDEQHLGTGGRRGAGGHARVTPLLVR